MDITIFILSRGRATAREQVTLQEIMAKSKRSVVLLVHESEKSAYEAILPVFGCDADRIQLMTFDCPEPYYLGHYRQWAIENSPTQGVVQIDDDMQFYRRLDGDTHMRYPVEIDSMFDMLEQKLDEYAHGGLSTRQGNNFHEEDEAENYKVIDLMSFDRDIFLGEKLDFREFIAMADYYITLMLLSRGYYNFISYKWAIGQKAAGQPGGCALYRSKEVLAACAKKLHDIFPDYVTVVTKNTQGEGTFGGARTDVNIQWKRCFCSRVEDRLVPLDGTNS